MIEHALKYAALGWKVFPAAPGQKVPITAHGVKDATSEETRIRDWWAKWPTANIAVACGSESGVYVIDVDVSATGDVDGRKSLEEFPPLPATVRQETPRGGFHAFYRTDTPPANRNAFRPGIDIRGNGYYVVLAPSIHPSGGRYAWSVGRSPWECQPAEYPEFMRPAVRVPWASVPAAAPTATAPSSPASSDVLERARMYLAECEPAVQGQGGHDKLLWAAGAMVHGFLLSDEQAFDLLAREYNPRCVPPWDLSVPKDDRDFRRKISEARRRPSQHAAGWLLNDPAYAPIDTSCIDVQSLIAGSQAVQLPQVIERPQVAVAGDDYLNRPTGLLGEICSWINATALKEQPFLTLGCSLAFLGALFGRKIKDELGSRTNIYCMGVAPSSAGKAHAMNAIRRLCAEAGCADLLGGETLASDAAIESRLAKEPATLFLMDEIGHLLAHIKSGISTNHAQIVATLMRLYSAAGNIYKGREYADDERQRTIIQPCCCIYGTSTPERFAGGVSPDELQDGWLSRCLVFQSKVSPPKSRGRKEAKIPQQITEAVAAWFARKQSQPMDGKSIAQFVGPGYTVQPPTQIVVPTAADAERVFAGFDEHSAVIGRQKPQVACLWAKAEENARRIALIVAAGENFQQPEVSAAVAEYSCRLVERLLADFATTIVPEIVTSDTDAKKRKIVAVINRAGVDGCTQTELTVGTQWANRKWRNELAEDLIEAGVIVRRQVGKTLRYWAAAHYLTHLEMHPEAVPSDA